MGIFDYITGKAAEAARNKAADIGKKVGHAAEIAKQTGKTVVSDIETRVNDACNSIEKVSQDKIYPLIDEMSKEGYFRDIANTIFDYAKKPKQAKEKLSEKIKQYDSKLAELAINEPRKGGFVDGFLHAFISNYKPDRNRKSSKYRESAKFGQATGYVVAAATFLTGGGIVRVGVATLPATTRLYNYMKERVTGTDAYRSGPGTPT